MDREPLSKQVELADVDDALHTQSLDKPDYYSWAIVERYYSSRAATESKGVKGSSWHDVWAAVLFWCTAAGVVALAGLWGVPFLLNAVAHPHDGSFSGVYKLVLGAVAVSTVLGSIFAAASIAFVMALRGGVIVAGVFAFGTILFGCAIVAAWWHWLACFLLFCVFVGYCLLMWWVWRWMDLAKALVEVACEAVNALPSLYGVVAGFFGVQAVWVIVWFVAAVGVNYRTDFGASIAGMPTVVTEHAGSPVKPVAAYGIFIALLLVLVWGVMNWNSVVGFTVAASVGHWALYPHPSRAVPTVTGSSSGGGATSAAGAAALSPSPVVGSLRRAVGPSFGSLAFGNMIYAFAEALRITATLAREGAATDGNYCLCCMYCIVEVMLRCVADTIEYINKLVFTAIALRGVSYCQGITQVKRTLGWRPTGWLLLFNRDWSSLAFLGVSASFALLGGGVCALAGYFFGGKLGDVPGTAKGHAVAAGVVGALVTLAIVSMAMTVFTSAVSSIMFCFLDAPFTCITGKPRDPRTGNSFTRLGSAVKFVVGDIVNHTHLADGGKRGRGQRGPDAGPDLL